MTTFWYAVSLGPDCEAKYQLARRYGRRFAPSGVFDWQVTPPPAALEYFDRNFAGLFELGDLETGPFGVENARFGTIHLHEFKPGIGAAEIATTYPQARARHDYLCRKMQRLLGSNLRLLFVLGQANRGQDVEGLRAVVRRKHPHLSFDILVVPRSAKPTNSAEAWQGDDAMWDRVLADRRPAARAVRSVFPKLFDGLNRDVRGAPLLAGYDALPMP